MTMKKFRRRWHWRKKQASGRKEKIKDSQKLTIRFHVVKYYKYNFNFKSVCNFMPLSYHYHSFSKWVIISCVCVCVCKIKQINEISNREQQIRLLWSRERERIFVINGLSGVSWRSVLLDEGTCMKLFTRILMHFNKHKIQKLDVIHWLVILMLVVSASTWFMLVLVFDL